MLQRLLHGFLGFLCCKATVTCCRFWFPDHVNLVIGLEMSMNFLGGGLCILMSGYIYQALSFNGPYFVVSLLSAVCWLFNFIVMPKTLDPVHCKPKSRNGNADDTRENEKSDSPEVDSNSDETDEKGLSWLVLFPLTAQALNALIEGFSAAITTSYLKEEFGIDIGEGSSFLFVMFLSFIVGASGTGYILQRGWLSSFGAMIAGASLSILGLFLLFPVQNLPALYQHVPKLAYVGTALMGLGVQLISIATLPALEDIHVGIARRRNTRKSKSQAASFWIIFWMLAVYVGHLVALLVMKFMSYSHGGWMIAGCSGISVSICLVLEILRRRLSPISR